jgi:6-phosphogluconolactonase
VSSAAQIVVDAPDVLASTLARRLEAEARRAMAKRGFFACALPGGSVASSFFPALSRAAVDWTRVEFFWTDERGVAPDHADSNYRLARELWLDRVPVRDARVHRMPGESPDLAKAAREYASEMARVLGPSAALDMAILGVGADGHVCSLFPGHPAAAEGSSLAVAVLDAPKPPARRLTLTFPALAAAGLLAIATQGEAKAEVVREAVEVETSMLPISRALRASRRPPLLLLDPAAARGIQAASKSM